VEIKLEKNGKNLGRAARASADRCKTPYQFQCSVSGVLCLSAKQDALSLSENSVFFFIRSVA